MNKMRISLKIFLLSALLFHLSYGFHNNLLEKAQTLIEKGQYASAHNLLWKLNHSEQATDTSICIMVDNVFNNNVYHKNFERFFLIDKTIFVEPPIADYAQRQTDTLMVSFTKPEPWIKRALEINEKNGMAYFLLGYYFYQSRLPELTVETPLTPKNSEIEKEIAVYYEKAFKYGYRHKLLFRFLGEYYSKQHPRVLHRAKKFYRWNAMERYFDPESVIELAGIYLHEKKTKQALDLGFSALSHLHESEINLKYFALRIIANANRELGEIEKFDYYNNLCLQLIPEQSDAFIDRIEYYDTQQQIDSVLIWLDKLFAQNPFDAKNYKMVEYISEKYNVNNELLDLLNRNREIYAKYDAVLAYSWWVQGDIYYRMGKKGLAKAAWEKSKEFFLKFISPHDPILKQIGQVKRK